MHGPIPRQRAIHCLQHIQLPTRGPRRPMSNRVPEHPKSRPNPLLRLNPIPSKPHHRLGDRLPPRRRRKRVLGLNPPRDPAPRNAPIAPGDELQGGAAAGLDRAGAATIGLELVVDTEVAVDDVPVPFVGEGARIAREGVGPDEGEVGVGGGRPGGGQGEEGEEVEGTHGGR